ncbi:hypothetical protein F5Y12DRAFT_288187 [Xylaria sp. FL1777]|nr:hypothetical protein F5Y12DRAFT_288187 [Xylaria sp. FL1777]
MPRSKQDHDFEIHIDPSCLSTPMDEEVLSPTSDVDKTSRAPPRTQYTQDTNGHLSSDDGEVDPPITTKSSGQKSDAGVSSTTKMNKDSEQKKKRQGMQPSVEADDEEDMKNTRPDSRASSRRATERAARDDNSIHDEELEEHSILSERTDRSFQPDDGEHSYVDHSELDPEGASHVSDTTPRVGDGDESSSQHGGTDEDVFTDKSPRSSMGSYDAGSESGKGVDIDNMTTITRSPRISDISQYDKEEFIPTARGTPRPPFRTPSDVRAMQMSSPTGSVLGSPRSSKKHFPTVSRLGTPSASAQYSPKRRSTPPRFKSRNEAPLVLLHVTLLPLRWMWGDLVNNLDPDEMSDQAKTLRNSWRILQDRVGDTVIERGILLGHPQNDYEVLEERLLEALDLPVRWRARILECGHYLGPSNETTLTEEEEESEDDYGKRQSQSSSKRHWCATCKSEIRYDSLGGDKIFRVKVYASNGLMRAGAWEACWKEMERVDVELEPIVEPTVQDEIVRLAATQQEREIAQQEEAEIAKEVALQYEEQRRKEELQQQQEAQAQQRSSPSPEPEVVPEAVPEEVHEPIRESRSSRRRHRDEERLREIYGENPPPPESHDREPSPHPDSSAHPPPPPRAPEEERANEQRDNHRGGYQSASLPELLWQSVRVLMQDRKNVIIVTLSLFVLLLSLRSTPPEPPYEPIVHRLKNMPDMERLPVINTPPVAQEYQYPMEDPVMEPILATPSSEAARNEPSHSSLIYHEESHSQPSQSSSPNESYEEPSSIEEPSVISTASEPAYQPTQETSTSPTSVSTIYEPCESPVDSSPSVNIQVSSAVCDTSTAQEATPTPINETVQETVEEIETITEKKVVRVIHTVTETQIHTQTEVETETQTEAGSATIVETATTVEAAELEATETTVEAAEFEATETPQVETSSNLEDTMPESQDATILPEEEAVPSNEAAENDSVPEPTPEAFVESVAESVAEPVAEPGVEPEEVPVEV